MTASPNSAKCVQCNAPVVGNDFLCQSCQAQKSSGKPGSASPPNVSQPSHMPTPPLPTVTDPNKKRVRAMTALASAAFLLVCIVGAAHYFVGLRTQNNAARRDLAELRRRNQRSSGPVLPGEGKPLQLGSGRMAAGTFVFVDTGTAWTEILDFKDNGSYVQTTQRWQTTRSSPGSYGMNGLRITLQEKGGQPYSGHISGDVILMNWATGPIRYVRVGALFAGQRATQPSSPPSDDRQQPDAPNQTRDTSSQQQSGEPSTPSSPSPSNPADDYIREAGLDARQTFAALRKEADRLTREMAVRGVNRSQRAGAQMNITPYLRQLDRDAATIQQNIPYASATGKLHGQSYLETIQKAEATLAQYQRVGMLDPTYGSSTGQGITDTSIFGGIHFLASGRGQAVRNIRDGDTTTGQDQ